MKLSTRGRYGVRAMLELAMNGGKAPVPLRDLASRQEISAKYLEQLLIPLKGAGLVKSVRVRDYQYRKFPCIKPNLREETNPWAVSYTDWR